MTCIPIERGSACGSPRGGRMKSFKIRFLPLFSRETFPTSVEENRGGHDRGTQSSKEMGEASIILVDSIVPSFFVHLNLLVQTILDTMELKETGPSPNGDPDGPISSDPILRVSEQFTREANSYCISILFFFFFFFFSSVFFFIFVKFRICSSPIWKGREYRRGGYLRWSEIDRVIGSVFSAGKVFRGKTPRKLKR